MKTCKKKGHASEFDARLFHQLRSDKKYSIYKCLICNLFHVTTVGPSEKFLNILESKILSGQATHIAKLSKSNHIWEIQWGKKSIQVIYNKKYKTVELIQK